MFWRTQLRRRRYCHFHLCRPSCTISFSFFLSCQSIHSPWTASCNRSPSHPCTDGCNCCMFWRTQLRRRRYCHFHLCRPSCTISFSFFLSCQSIHSPWTASCNRSPSHPCTDTLPSFRVRLQLCQARASRNRTRCNLQHTHQLGCKHRPCKLGTGFHRNKKYRKSNGPRTSGKLPGCSDASNCTDPWLPHNDSGTSWHCRQALPFDIP